MSASKDKAKEIKSLLLEKFSGASWLRGIGLAHGVEPPTIRVNVEGLTEELCQQIKSFSQDVPIIVDEVREITAK